MSILVFLIIIINTLISAYNAYSCGRIWSVCQGFMKIAAVAGLIVSVAGFIQTWVLLIGFITEYFGWLKPDALNALFSMTYVLIVLPVIGSGIILTIQSWIAAVRTRNVGSGAGAVWNTGATAYDIYQAMETLPNAFNSVINFFSSEDEDSGSKASVALIFTVAVMMSLGSTYFFFQKGQNKTADEIQVDKHLKHHRHSYS